jgi:triacylglycerol lipase
MISYWLRWRLAAEAVTLAVAAAAAVRAGVASPMLAGAAAFFLFVAVHSGAVILSFAVSRRHACKGAPRLTLRTALREWLAYLALFVLIQPFERWWMGEDSVGRNASGRVPVLLIHGYLCNRGTWWWLRRRLRTAGFAVATVDLEPPFASIESLADRLHTRIEALRAEAGADRIVLVGHSMGGLAARAYLRAHGASRVAKLVTLASPHHGTWIARYGPGKNAREMEPDSAWLGALPAVDVPAVSLWSPADNFVAPQDSGRLAGARETILPALTHLAMLFSPLVLDTLTRELASSNRLVAERSG